MSNLYQVVSWNLENLFDAEDAPRSDKLQRALGKSLKGWTRELRDRKIAQLASLIRSLNADKGPDILAVSEVENAEVMKLLGKAMAVRGRSYAIVHHDSKDERGIDVGFIYDRKLFKVEKVFDHFVMRRNATRDILQVNFRTMKGNLLVLLNNHWPSRSGGRYESAGYRMIAGETLAYFHSRIVDIYKPAVPVMAMGDFNDEPFDISLVEHALACRSLEPVMSAREVPRFHNLMWPLAGSGRGTFYFKSQFCVLDQFLANKFLFMKGQPIRVKENSVAVINAPRLVKGKSGYPRQFGRAGEARKIDEEGFSDHFPIAVELEEH